MQESGFTECFDMHFNYLGVSILFISPVNPLKAQNSNW